MASAAAHVHARACVYRAHVWAARRSDVDGIGLGAQWAARGAAHLCRLVRAQLRHAVQRDDDGSASS